jgi:hypothetical protein
MPGQQLNIAQRAACLVMPGRQAKTLSSADVNDLLLFASCTRQPLRLQSCRADKASISQGLSAFATRSEPLVVPFAAGGPSDVAGRIVAGQSVVAMRSSASTCIR